MESEANVPEAAKVKSKVSETIDYLKDLAAAGPTSMAGRGLEIGLSAVLAKTALRHLPAPLNLVVPLVVEKVILKHGVEEGRELLLKALYWIKDATEDDPLEVV